MKSHQREGACSGFWFLDAPALQTACFQLQNPRVHCAPTLDLYHLCLTFNFGPSESSPLSFFLDSLFPITKPTSFVLYLLTLYVHTPYTIHPTSYTYILHLHPYPWNDLIEPIVPSLWYPAALLVAGYQATRVQAPGLNRYLRTYVYPNPCKFHPSTISTTHR